MHLHRDSNPGVCNTASMLTQKSKAVDILVYQNSIYNLLAACIKCKKNHFRFLKTVHFINLKQNQSQFTIVMKLFYEQVLFHFEQETSRTIHFINSNIRGGFRGGGAPGPGPPIFLESYICPYANTCLKISSCIDLKCLLYVYAIIKIQFDSTTCIFSHTHPPLGRYASSCVRAPYLIILDPPLNMAAGPRHLYLLFSFLLLIDLWPV